MRKDGLWKVEESEGLVAKKLPKQIEEIVWLIMQIKKSERKNCFGSKVLIQPRLALFNIIIT